jgi:Dockerin type I domain/Bacterial Ig domain
MRRRFSSPNRSNNGARPQRVRSLRFDSLEDRRLLAGLNVFVYDDVNQSGSWQQATESPLVEHVVYIDQDNNGQLGANEKHAVTDAAGQASFQNVQVGQALIRLFGSTVSLPVAINDPLEVVTASLAGRGNDTNQAPTLGEIAVQEIDEDLVLEIAISLLSAAASDSNGDSLAFFVTAGPANGSLVWSVESGGQYKPNANYFGNDSFTVRAFDGHAWSAPSTIAILVKSVDDAPTAMVLDLNPIVENHVGVDLGTLTLEDVDGGDYRFEISPNGLFELVNGRFKLAEGMSVDFEQTPSIEIGISVIDTGPTSAILLTGGLLANVINQNDLPTALTFDIVPRVEEFVAGYQFGTVTVEDADVGEVYDFVTNDSRFDVVDGTLQLKAGSSLAHADGNKVSVTVTATSRSSGDQISGTAEIEVVRGAPPWQNKHWALDVNNDGKLDPIDVLVVINALNRLGVVELNRLPPPGSPTFVDVNGDRMLTPIDALILINALNRQQNEPSGSGGGNSSGSGGTAEGSGGGEGESPDPVPAPQPTTPRSIQYAGLNSPDSIGNISAAPVDDDLTDLNRRNARRSR